MSDTSFSPEQLEKLMHYAAGRLGTTPEQLRRTVEQQGLAGLAGTLPPDEAAQAQALLGNREKANQLLQDPRVQQLLSQLLKGQ
ncbi:MAG: hypothetical protein IIW40_02600 [Clostridia bacterium]|nr:hypothetical protein [Clostridia bacterium]